MLSLTVILGLAVLVTVGGAIMRRALREQAELRRRRWDREGR